MIRVIEKKQNEYEAIRYRDLSGPLKFAVVVSWIIGFIWILILGGGLVLELLGV